MIAFVHIFKTAGTTLTGILRRNFSARHFDTRLIQENPAIAAWQLRRAMLLYPRLKSIAGHAVRPHGDLKAVFPEIRFYTFLRDPRARLVSSFLFSRGIAIRQNRGLPPTDREIESEFAAYLASSKDLYCRIFARSGGGATAAIEAIETKLEFVGLVEHFDESLALLRNWIGEPGFDPAYRLLNDSERRGGDERKFRRFQKELERLTAVTRAAAARPEIAERIAAAQPGDIALYDHVRTRTFEEMRRRYSAGPGPFSFEDRTSAADTIPGRLYRNVVGRPFVHLVARAPNAVR